MTQVQWTAVDQYFADAFTPSDPILEAALAASVAAGLPDIQVTPLQGQLLALLAQSLGARRILEIGTLGGYSTIWLARTLPADGQLITLELDAHHAAVARSNFAQAGLDNLIQLREGKAIDLLPSLTEFAPFDFIFIDADKDSTADYFDWSVKLARPGSLILVDNAIRSGGVVDPNHPDSRVQGIRRFVAAAANDSRVQLSTVQTVGSKGYDGFALALVK